MMKQLILMVALACAMPAFADPAWVRGEVVKLDVAKAKVVLKHGPIPHLKMAAMTMPFRVGDPAVLAPLKVGDPVRFEVDDHGGELYVHRIEVLR